MKLLVISDTHGREQFVEEKIISCVDHTAVLFLGDAFDAYNDDASKAYLTAKWLKWSLNQSNRIHCFGNHDLPYHYINKANFTACPGWTPNKHERVNEVLTAADWNKLKFYYRHNNWIFSHAGIWKSYFTHPIHGFSLGYFESECIKAREMVQAGLIHPCFYYGTGMGESRVGGLFWLRWNVFAPIENVNQVVGHTIFEKPHCKKGENSINWCMDTSNAHYGIFDGEKFEVFNV